ncbi:rhodanese-like domain-containing protein [Halosimplex litoreum]|uniref:Rhodanese-like domain-containing protein n=1 Tax=Halosimplex litoreum TaxID=1198301 RepID=A0A7T3KU88_9EURY|nr:rhodanese-like domain-containing protein [Halosimplex litoreum]QPV62007.1 rhodanese-like domain-containing protein [Halosimplex litoreum]
MSAIRPSELAERLESGSTDRPFVLDIRPTPSYRSDAIDGSHSLPVYDELRRGEEGALLDRLEEVPADRDVVVVCKMGIVAKKATGLLVDEGYDAATLLGGMSGWNGYHEGSLTYRLRSLIWRLR